MAIVKRFLFLFRGFPRRFTPRNDEGKNVIQSGVGVPPDFHQADNLAQLWQEFLSLLELIAQILCAVAIAKTSAVRGNRHCVFISILRIPTSLCSSE